jgi:hypothetical protein
VYWGSLYEGQIGRVAENVPAPPQGLAVMLPSGGLNKLFPQIGDKAIDDPELRFVHPAIKVIEDHLLCHCGALGAGAAELADAVESLLRLDNPQDAAANVVALRTVRKANSPRR